MQSPKRALTSAGLLILTAVCASLPACAADRHPVTGRAFAGVMGVGGADWLERAEREDEEHTSVAVRLLGLKPGMAVADIGAGSGYYTERMARAVGPSGKVYANDIQPGMLQILTRRVKERGLKNVEAVLGAIDDPQLPAGCCDLILMVDVYHEFSAPQAMIRKLRAALKHGGRLVLLEYRKEDPAVPIRPEHKMSVEEVKAELEPEGLKLEKVLPDLPWQHMLFFQK